MINQYYNWYLFKIINIAKFMSTQVSRNKLSHMIWQNNLNYNFVIQVDII